MRILFCNCFVISVKNKTFLLIKNTLFQHCYRSFYTSPFPPATCAFKFHIYFRWQPTKCRIPRHQLGLCLVKLLCKCKACAITSCGIPSNIYHNLCHILSNLPTRSRQSSYLQSSRLEESWTCCLYCSCRRISRCAFNSLYILWTSQTSWCSQQLLFQQQATVM